MLEADEDGLRLDDDGPVEPVPGDDPRSHYESEKDDPAFAFGVVTPRSPRAAFRLGNLVRQVRIAHAVFSTTPNIPDALDRQRQCRLFDANVFKIQNCCKSLAGEFDRNVLGEVEAALDRLDRYSIEFISSQRGGRRETPPNDVLVREFQPVWLHFRYRADSALPPESPLRGLYDAGSEIGDYQQSLLPFLDAADRGVATGPLPDLGPILRSLKGLPIEVIGRIQWLLDTTRFDGSPIRISPRAFVERINARWPLGEPSDTALAISVAVRYLYNAISNGLTGLTYESLPTPRTASLRLHWDPGRGELSLDGEIIATFGTQATNLRPVLDKFSQLGWPNRIPNPFTEDPNKAYKTVSDLNKKQGRIKFGTGDHTRVVTLTIMPLNTTVVTNTRTGYAGQGDASRRIRHDQHRFPRRVRGRP